MTKLELLDKVKAQYRTLCYLPETSSVNLSRQVRALLDALLDTGMITLPQATEPTEEFLSFWHLYPRKAGKANAWKAWLKHNPPPLTVMASVRKYIKAGWDGKELQYIPHAATWLNQKRYYEEPEAPGAIATDPEAEARRQAAQAKFEGDNNYYTNPDPSRFENGGGA